MKQALIFLLEEQGIEPITAYFRPTESTHARWVDTLTVFRIRVETLPKDFVVENLFQVRWIDAKFFLGEGVDISAMIREYKERTKE
jgi:hypothetical protein